VPEDVLKLAEAFAREHVPGADGWRLLEPAFRDLEAYQRRHRTTIDALHCVYLPRLVHAAITGEEEPALQLTVALLFLHMGTELLDDVMDADLGTAWEGVRPDEICLAGAAFCSTLAPLALSAVDAPAETVLAMQRTLAGGLLAMFQGQATDVALTGAHSAPPAEVEASIVGKCGGALAMYAALGAQVAGAKSEIVDAYAEIGRCLGVAAQIRSECVDLFLEDTSRDLVAGSRTLPIAFYLERLTGEERKEFLDLLECARHEPAAQEAVRECLRAVNVLRDCAIRVDAYCDRARETLFRTCAREPAAGELHQLIQRSSFIGTTKRQKPTASAHQKAAKS
jgi:geranylgeranyl pyrophosphate synthase